MNSLYHVLNGDALKERFPKEIEGAILICRECLVEGDVTSQNLEELYQVRAQFISENYHEVSEEDYYLNTVSQFGKICDVPKGSEIHLWFEDDLFCQVNFWFVSYLIYHFTEECEVYLIRPKEHTAYGFGGINKSGLIDLYRDRRIIQPLDQITHLWECFKAQNIEGLLTTASALNEHYPFILKAVEAFVSSLPRGNYPGRPMQSLIEIVNQLKTDDFGTIFKEFSQRESIYGFGDVQVKRMLASLRESNNF